MNHSVFLHSVFTLFIRFATVVCNKPEQETQAGRKLARAFS